MHHDVVKFHAQIGREMRGNLGPGFLIHGVVIVFARDKDGRYILDGDEIQTETRYGVVTVVPA